MKLYVKIDAETGQKYIGAIKGEEIPIGLFAVVIQRKDEITNPINGQLGFDDDYIYIYIGDRWKKTSITIC